MNSVVRSSILDVAMTILTPILERNQFVKICDIILHIIDSFQ
jgi:hypothetical protein